MVLIKGYSHSFQRSYDFMSDLKVKLNGSLLQVISFSNCKACLARNVPGIPSGLLWSVLEDP